MLFTHSLIHSFTHSFIHSLIHSFIHSFIHLLIHSFIHSPIIYPDDLPQQAEDKMRFSLFQILGPDIDYIFNVKYGLEWKIW